MLVRMCGTEDRAPVNCKVMVATGSRYEDWSKARDSY